MNSRIIILTRQNRGNKQDGLLKIFFIKPYRNLFSCITEQLVMFAVKKQVCILGISSTNSTKTCIGVIDMLYYLFHINCELFYLLLDNTSLRIRYLRLLRYQLVYTSPRSLPLHDQHYQRNYRENLEA